MAQSCHQAGLTEVSDMPLMMKQRTLRKIAYDHEISLGQLRDLPNWIRDHPLALDSLTDEGSIVVVADARDKDGLPIVIAVRIEREYEAMVVDEVTSVYGKRNLAYLVENTVNAGLGVYANDRTERWLSSMRLPLPQSIATHLAGIIRGHDLEINARQGASAEVLAWSPHQGEPKPDWVVSFRDDVWNPEEGRTFGVIVDSGQELFVHPGEVLVREPFGWYEVKTAECFEEQRRMFASSLDASCEVPARQQPPRQTPSSAERSARDQAAATKGASTQEKDKGKALKPWERTNHF